ncbi:endonuclease domain-containing protein [Picosynechococcus sp. NKBG042902]|uniref:endonuclease domain-containing protein n=1 Tax=Picosynechococcus sp. NKBG042902 TaxID=490193 RepID=UPI0004AA1BE3|nr:endonuclease domain-containing protein [Picosynechococcus sp. NKBG042902]
MTLVNAKYHLPYNPDLIARAKQLRQNMTPAEKKLWFGFLKNFKYRIYRQRPIDYFIVDFYCPKLNLVIEVDGDSHYTPQGQKYDQERTEKLKGYGLKVIRFSNQAVLNNFTGVCEALNQTTTAIDLIT